MNEIQCPHCSKAFKVDETGYANILKQVYDHEFENQLSERLTQKEREQASELKLAKMDADIAIQNLKAEKEVEIERLRSTIREKESSVQATVDKAVREMEKERDNLKNDLKNSKKSPKQESRKKIGQHCDVTVVLNFHLRHFALKIFGQK